MICHSILTRRGALAAFGIFLSAGIAHAQIDNLVAIVDTTTATGGKPIAAFGYNPIEDSMFVSSFGAGSGLRKVINVSTTPTSSVYVSEAQLQLYYRDGDPDRGVSAPLQSGILFNPVAIGSLAPYEMAVFADSSFTRFPASSTTDPAATKRFYSYNLEPVPPGGDGRDVFSTLATLSEMQVAIGTDNTSSNQGRQFAWSGDGQSIYFIDASTAFGGLWKLDPLDGQVEQLLPEDEMNDDMNTEPAVLHNAGVDSIYFRGSGPVGNEGGIDKVTYDGVTVGARATVVSGAELRAFLDAPADSNATVFSMTSDAAGNLYFNNTASPTNSRGMFRLDSQGRLSKVASYVERDLFFTGEINSPPAPNANTLRMQTRAVTHLTAGSVTQILYAESSQLNFVAGAYAFEPGDFDRDGDLDSDDIGLFQNALQTRGTSIADADHYKFDLNGNAVVDWRDVIVLQQFALFPDGDANMDGMLDFVDLDTVGDNYYTNPGAQGKVWTQGDFASVDPLYATDAIDANLVNETDLALFANTWLNVLEQPILESEITSRGYNGQFLTDALAAFGFGLDGDYNGDGRVDAADYTVWRDGLNAGFAANGYDKWKSNFGSTPGDASTASVPEPASISLLVLAQAALLYISSRRDK